jgi:hypothetical protein
VLGLDLAGDLVDAEPVADLLVGLADRAELDPPVEVRRGDGGVLGHAVELVDVEPDPHEELEDLGGDGSGAGARQRQRRSPTRSRRARKTSSQPMA